MEDDMKLESMTYDQLLEHAKSQAVEFTHLQHGRAGTKLQATLDTHKAHYAALLKDLNVAKVAAASPIQLAKEVVELQYAVDASERERQTYLDAGLAAETELYILRKKHAPLWYIAYSAIWRMCR
jgi:hypothetical protein